MIRSRCKAFRIGCDDSRVVRLDCCTYGTNYRKRTRLMTNSPFKGTLCERKCPGFKDGNHVEAAHRGPYFTEELPTLTPSDPQAVEESLQYFK
ncbi:hypothetical protein Q5P01_020018 [Channa striata]|uniref:Uncharacterized protein n=1 Tax=Channa striata TaxID=64152 RepID=A0AA88S2Q5_CHASR|nr:hypothetical protein Q5P01_020018 [Channa striata]